MSVSGHIPSECRECRDVFPVAMAGKCASCLVDQTHLGRWTGTGWTLEGFGHWLKDKGYVCHKCWLVMEGEQRRFEHRRLGGAKDE